MKATRWGHTHTMQLLVEAKADVNAKNMVTLIEIECIREKCVEDAHSSFTLALQQVHWGGRSAT